MAATERDGTPEDDNPEPVFSDLEKAVEAAVEDDEGSQ